MKKSVVVIPFFFSFLHFAVLVSRGFGGLMKTWSEELILLKKRVILNHSFFIPKAG